MPRITSEATAAERKPLNPRHFYAFDDFRLDADEERLFKGKERIELAGGAKSFALLLLFVRRAQRLVRRDEIVAALWSDVNVGEENLINVHVSQIRKAIGENYVETVPRKGYRFTRAVTRVEEGAQPDSAARPHVRVRLTIASALLLVAVAAAAYSMFFRPKPITSVSDALYQRALTYERAGDDEQARAVLDQALASAPRNYAACVRAAYLSYELEESNKAGEYLQKCGTLSRISDEALRLKADALSELLRDNRTESLRLLELLRDRYPKDTDGLYRFAEVATDMDRVEEARSALGACLGIEPDNPYCQFQMMYVQLKENRFDDIVADFSRLPAKLREYPWLQEPLGVAFMAKGDFEAAKQAFDRLAASQVKLHGTAHFTVGKEWGADVLLYQGRIADATRRIESLMETADNSPVRGNYLAYLAQVNAYVGDARATKRFALAASEPNTDAASLTLAAVAVASIGDQNAVDRLLKLRSAKSNGAPLTPSNDHLIRGLLSLAKRDLTAATEELRLAHELAPKDPVATFWLGDLYLRSSDYKRASATFEALLEMRGTVLLDDAPLVLPLTERKLANCYDKLGDAARAAELREQVARTWSAADLVLKSGKL
jgi:DNA-binding winged helix-turn-helix (wHTH) protein/uncharacterized protein HemY